MISIAQSNYKDFLNIHSSSIINYCERPTVTKYKISKINKIINKYFNDYVTDFESLIKATPEKLKKIKESFDKMPNDKIKKIKTSLNLNGLYDYFVKENTYKYENNQYGAKYLAKRIDVFTCPYCNENFTYSFNNSFNRTFEWDHIYPKEKYPFLAISFFNLIPSCKVCNKIKKENSNFLNLHNRFDNNMLFFDAEYEEINGFYGMSKIKLNLFVNKKFKYKNELKVNINTLKIKDRYNEHKQTVNDILLKKRIFTKTYINKLKKQFIELKTLEDINVNEIIYNVRLNSDEFYKRPFSKLTYDILNDDKI